MDRQKIFNAIYANGIWNNSSPTIPKSGPGSSVKNTQSFRSFFDTFCEKNDVKEVLDIGCGDLTWMPLTTTFQTKRYTGIDIVQSLIDSHRIKYPQHTFLCLDAITQDLSYSEVVIIRDVLFHLTIEDIQTLLAKIRCKYLIMTSCKNAKNTNHFDRCHYHTINLTIEPFNMVNYIESLYEPEFNRNVHIYQRIS